MDENIDLEKTVRDIRRNRLTKTESAEVHGDTVQGDVEKNED